MAKQKHTLLWVAGGGVAAFAAYRYLFEPWAAEHGFADDVGGGASGGGGSWPQSGWPLSPTPLTPTAPPVVGNLLPPPMSMLEAPGVIIGYNSLGPQYGGVLGACIARKGGTWSASKCAQRLNDLVAAAKTAKAKVAELKAGAPQNAAGVPAAQAQLALVQQALTNDTVQYNAALQRGDTAAASQWHAALISHQTEAADIQARIAAAQTPVINTAAVAAWEGALAGHDQDYFNLTGVRLLPLI